MTRRDRVTLGLLVSAQFLVMLDASIVNVALPSIQEELDFGPAAVTWVVNAYVLAFAGLLLLSGRAADLVGRRRIFVSGAALFTAGTLLAAAAVNQEMLILGRIVQGVGAAGLSPAAMSLLLATFPAAQRARAMGAWGAASTLGGATGVVSGGVLAGTVGWRAVFLVTVPVSLAALALARRVLAEDVAGVRRTFDWAGAAAVSGAVIALVHGAVDAVDHAWTSPRVGGLLATSLVLMTAFLAIERRAADPLVPLELFRSGLLRRGTIVALLGGASRASTFVLVALYFQQVLALSPAQAGIAMVPTSLAGFAVSLAVLPRLLGAIGPVRSMVLGLVVLAAGHLWLAHVPTGSGYVVAVLPALLLVATGVALSFTPTTMVLASAVPATHTGLASGLAGASMQIGGALGTAGFIVVGIAAGGPVHGALDGSGFSAAFTAAAIVSLLTAALASHPPAPPPLTPIPALTGEPPRTERLLTHPPPTTHHSPGGTHARTPRHRRRGGRPHRHTTLGTDGRRARRAGPRRHRHLGGQHGDADHRPRAAARQQRPAVGRHGVPPAVGRVPAPRGPDRRPGLAACGLPHRTDRCSPRPRCSPGSPAAQPSSSPAAPPKELPPPS